MFRAPWDDDNDDDIDYGEKPQAISDLGRREHLEIVLKDPNTSREINSWLKAARQPPRYIYIYI